MNGDNPPSRGERDGGRHRSSREHHSHRGGDDHKDRDRGGRRRSRSPGHRGGARREPEPDSYSSSREYRQREREDRYRDRRDEREWDRDRGPRAPRDHGDRPPRRERGDRDLFDDRRGGGRRGERDGAGLGGGAGAGGRDRERRKSASPPPKKREPTPDLTDIVPITERKRRLTQWDIKPPGYENVTAEQAKLSGMFPLPGAPQRQGPDAQRPKSDHPTGPRNHHNNNNYNNNHHHQDNHNNNNNNNLNNANNITALRTANAKQSKRLFTYKIPAGTTNDSLTEFFNLHLNGLNVVSGVDPCVSARIAQDGSFGILEFKAPEDATMALALDGIEMERSRDTDMANGDANGGQSGLSIKRPKDYIVPTSTDEPEASAGADSSVVKDSPNKVSVANIPTNLTDEQVKELLVSFGELKSFILVKDTGVDESKGIAFCEYIDPTSTDIAVEGLHGMELGEGTLKVQRASIGVTQASGLEMGVNAMSMLAGTTSTDLEQGRVLMLLNMVTADELMDNEEYEEICEDVKEECEKYGTVKEMKIPRPSGGNRQAAGVGKIFVKYDVPESAQKAIKALAGRKFADRTVVVTFFGEDYFDVEAW